MEGGNAEVILKGFDSSTITLQRDWQPSNARRAIVTAGANVTGESVPHSDRNTWYPLPN